MAKTQDQLYQQITDQIIAALEAGTPPWIRPWKATGKGGAFPHNARTGRTYNGINVLLLMMAADQAGYTSGGWLTFKQCADLGGHVRKGERGQVVCFWKFLEGEQRDSDGKTVRDADGNAVTRKIPMLRTYYVFNVQQCEGLELEAQPQLPIDDDAEAPELLPTIDAIGARVTYGGDRAYYTTRDDSIYMPRPETFKDRDSFYATLLHEITHWTGHTSRCDRQFGRRFGDEAYAAEELVAEIGSAFLCSHLGVPLEGLQHPSYIASWLRVLKSDNRAIFTASRHAQAAADYCIAQIRGEDADDSREAA